MSAGPPSGGPALPVSALNPVPGGARNVPAGGAQGDEWKSHQRPTGPGAKADYANPAQMNHFTWYQAHDWKKPYPGEDKIFAPENVPGADLPPAESDD